MKRILISGGSGLVGKQLISLLNSSGYECAILSRSADSKSKNIFYWNPQKKMIDMEALEYADVIVHLAGSNIASGRWTASRKRKIIKSRIDGTRFLFESLQKVKHKPELFISASAIGYYGTQTSKHIFKEMDNAGSGFLAETVIKWEKEAHRINTLDIPVKIVRIGMVLSDKGGVLGKLRPFSKNGIQLIFGSGKQWFPWVSILDLSRILVFLIEKDTNFSIYNAVAPQQINQEEFSKTITSSNFSLPIYLPSWMLNLILGEMSSLLLKGSRVSSDRIRDEGFNFKHENLKDFIS